MNNKKEVPEIPGLLFYCYQNNLLPVISPAAVQ
jgi:hypothetical protein